MNAVVLSAAVCCFLASGDLLVEKLDGEFQAMAQDDPARVQLYEAEKLLDQADQSGNHFNYISATKIIRQARSKAAVPLLLEYMIPHSELGSTRNVDEYADAIFLLTGHDVGDPYAEAKTVNDRAAAVRAAVSRLYVEWWIPNQDRLTTDFAKWPELQLERYVDQLVQRSTVSQNTMRRGKQDSAGGIRGIITYELPRSIDPEERGWFSEELHPRMVPILLARAGYQRNPTEDPRRSPFSISYGAIGMLAKLRADGEAPELDEIALDQQQGSAARLTCALAMHVAGEVLMPDVFFSVLATDKRLEPRLVAIVSLMLCKDAELAGPVLIGLLGDPNKEIREAAVCALGGSRPPAALPKLEEMLAGNRAEGFRSSLLGVIADYRNEEAVRILGEYLQTALADYRLADEVDDAFGALEKASGQRWRAAGAHDQAYYREKAEEALAWWLSQRSPTAGQEATGEYQHLLSQYRGTITLPDSLLKAYSQFVDVARQPTQEKLRSLCLPNSVRFTGTLQERDNPSYGPDMNIEFLQKIFSEEILDAYQEGDDLVRIRTGTSYIQYVHTASGGWMIYGYVDKSIL